MPIKNTEKKIKQQTNIHGHESHEELLEKREIKLQGISDEFSKAIIDVLKIDKEERKKKNKHIRSLQTTTDHAINEIFNNYTKQTINELRQKIKNKIDQEIIQKASKCDSLRDEIMQKEMRLDISEIAEEIFTQKAEIEKIIALVEDPSLHEKTLKKLNGYLIYIKRYI